MAVYFFYGDEDFNIELEIEKMKSKLNQDFIAMNFQVLDNPDYVSLITALRTPPMMFGEMLIVVNAEDYFLSQKNSFEESELSDIEDALKNNPTLLNIVFVVKLPRDEGRKLDSRRKLYKILNQYNAQEFPVFKTYKTAEISAWINQRAKKKDLSLKNDAVELLIEQIGNNLRQFDCELDKLKLMAYPEKIVTKKMVEDIAISNQDLFNLTEFIIKNQKDRALLEFQKLIDKKHPLEILSAIQTMLRKWIIIKTKASSLSTMELSKLTGQHEFVVKQTITKLKNTSASVLVDLKQNLFEVESRIKSGEVLDIVSEVEIALIK
ncbi:MAG: DNA polymerase III subunit delta [Cyanobacteria bacterium SIG28]|nr:DNA polymerase III subunit delta [Cyanobacteria bacterium SIG28]